MNCFFSGYLFLMSIVIVQIDAIISDRIIIMENDGRCSVSPFSFYCKRLPPTLMDVYVWDCKNYTHVMSLCIYIYIYIYIDR